MAPAGAAADPGRRITASSTVSVTMSVGSPSTTRRTAPTVGTSTAGASLVMPMLGGRTSRRPSTSKYSSACPVPARMASARAAAYTGSPTAS
ncbi:hypothetical protein [Verrucosispora sioxanthis]|uniref:hypothetical protein n=1 Tax=Verrucosispora sioxanthis TaxID=2499994 RepID=UPI0028150512|nr:hypothetical protein [Verrucosispora sioxanthis]